MVIYNSSIATFLSYTHLMLFLQHYTLDVLANFYYTFLYSYLTIYSPTEVNPYIHYFYTLALTVVTLYSVNW